MSVRHEYLRCPFFLFLLLSGFCGWDRPKLGAAIRIDRTINPPRLCPLAESRAEKRILVEARPLPKLAIGGWGSPKASEQFCGRRPWPGAPCRRWKALPLPCPTRQYPFCQELCSRRISSELIRQRGKS